MLIRAARDTSPPAPAAAIRCRACQLQLCKSRLEKPHAALKEIGRGELKEQVQYACDACNAVMEWCGDPAYPGWSHRK
ncbi:MAG: hypothetical protein K1X51_17180 [Rhodospirillaceae bacterium]|nr:hypothetical protein [Rhodospirillaceae bacterium]